MTRSASRHVLPQHTQHKQAPEQTHVALVKHGILCVWVPPSEVRERATTQYTHAASTCSTNLISEDKICKHACEYAAITAVHLRWELGGGRAYSPLTCIHPRLLLVFCFVGDVAARSASPQPHACGPTHTPTHTYTRTASRACET